MSSNTKNNSFKKDSRSTNRGGVLKYVGLFIVALAVVGLVFSSLFSGGGARNRNALVFGRYGDQDIEYRYDNAFGQAVENEMAKYDNNVDQGNQFFNFIRLMAWQQAFQTVALDAAITYHMEESGYEPSSRAVDRRVIEYGPYRTDGAFDENKYRSASDAAKASVRQRFHEQIVLETWSRDVLDGQYRSQNQLDFLADMKSTVKTYDYITIPFTDYPDSEVVKYAVENGDLFRTMSVSRITVNDEKTADEVMSQLNERRQDIGAFADLAREYSADAYKDDGGSMGTTDYFRLAELMSTESVDSVFSLKEGEFAGPFETEYGRMIFRSDSPVEASNPEERIEDIRSYMLQNEVGVIEDYLLARADVVRTIAASSDSFRVAMESEGLIVKSTAGFPVNYGADSLLGASPESTGEAELSGTASSEEFWNGIAALDRVGEISRPVVLSGAVGVFSLASSNEEEVPEYWDSMVDYEVARSRQTDFQSVILREESDLFVNEFSEAYNRIFPVQG